MPRKRFTTEGCDDLIDRTGADEGSLLGRNTIDQAYAQIQHERLDFKHPGGGQAKYLEEPLFSNHRKYLQTLADHVLDGGLEAAQAQNMESLAGSVSETAPVDTGQLRTSSHPQVIVDGDVRYDRPPISPREDQSR